MSDLSESRELARLTKENAELVAALENVNTMACYASEEDTESRAKVLLMIGETVRAALSKVKS